MVCLLGADVIWFRVEGGTCFRMWLRYIMSSRRSSLLHALSRGSACWCMRARRACACVREWMIPYLGMVDVPALSPSFMIHMRSRNMGGRPLFMAASTCTVCSPYLPFRTALSLYTQHAKTQAGCRILKAGLHAGWGRAQTCEDFAHFLEVDLFEFRLVVVALAHSLSCGVGQVSN